ncbi:hypothetical protein BJ166DRAFT_601759 [Pestalotiopsis sp. NC0098]|nr:hypothetical protein BJ166DRAFT_601759 [Pestalotiopsis sp. NC0098]
MGFLRRKKKADNGTSAPPNDHGQGSSGEVYRERRRRPSRIEGLRDGLASTMQTFRREPPAPTREGAYAHLEDGAYHGNPQDFASYYEQPNEQRRVHEPLHILHERPSYPDLSAAGQWRSHNRIEYTPDGSIHSVRSERRSEDRQLRNSEHHGNADLGWEQDELDQEQAFWGEESHTAGGYDLPEEGYSFSSDQLIMYEDDPHDAAEYSNADAHHVQAAHSPVAEQESQRDRTDSMTSDDWVNFCQWRDYMNNYRARQDR